MQRKRNNSRKTHGGKGDSLRTGFEPTLYSNGWERIWGNKNCDDTEHRNEFGFPTIVEDQAIDDIMDIVYDAVERPVF